MNPDARLMLFVMFIPIVVRARTFVILFAALTVMFALVGRSGIADLAHLGGLVFGWMYVYNILYLRRLIGGYGVHTAGPRRVGVICGADCAGSGNACNRRALIAANHSRMRLPRCRAACCTGMGFTHRRNSRQIAPGPAHADA